MVDMNDVSRRMDASVVSLSNDFSGLRAGRASTTMLDPVIVDAYGSKMSLNQLSNVSAPESRLLTVTVWDAGLCEAVEKAIRDSGLGLNPQAEGSVIRIPIPDLSEERRNEMKKIIKSMGEKCKISIRNIRREANDELKKLLKNKDISEDDVKKNEKIVQELTDNNINLIDEKVISKEKEIMTI